MTNGDQEPTLSELREFWREHRNKQKLDEMREVVNGNPQQRLENPAMQDRPVDPITHLPLSYEQMKSRFLTLQGRSKGWAVEDQTDHDINTPRPSEGKPEQSYQELRSCM